MSVSLALRVVFGSLSALGFVLNFMCIVYTVFRFCITKTVFFLIMLDAVICTTSCLALFMLQLVPDSMYNCSLIFWSTIVPAFMGNLFTAQVAVIR